MTLITYTINYLFITSIFLLQVEVVPPSTTSLPFFSNSHIWATTKSLELEVVKVYYVVQRQMHSYSISIIYNIAWQYSYYYYFQFQLLASSASASSQLRTSCYYYYYYYQSTSYQPAYQQLLEVAKCLIVESAYFSIHVFGSPIAALLLISQLALVACRVATRFLKMDPKRS